MIDNFAFLTGDKFFVLDINGRQEKVSVDAVKPAYIENHSLSGVVTLPIADTETAFPIPADQQSHDNTSSMIHRPTSTTNHT